MTPRDKFTNALEFYFSALKNKGRSPKTLENYEKTIRYFTDWMDETKKWTSDPSVSTIKEYAEYLSETKAPSSVRSYLVNLSCFYSFVSDETLDELRFYESNPVSKRLLPDLTKENKRPYDLILTDEQACKLWRNEKSYRTHTWERNYAIVTLLLSTEIRNGELLSLTPADLNFEDAELTVECGKGNKFRVVDFPEIAQTAIKLYLASGQRPSYAIDTDPLFGTEADCGSFGGHNNHGSEWHKGSAQWLSDLVENHVFKITGVHNVRTHDLRHIGSRLDLSNGMGIAELQAKLGHTSPVVTISYSGRLRTRSKRKSSVEAYAERDRWVQANYEQLALAV